MLQVEEVFAAYGAFDVLRGISIEAGPGRCVAVVGPNGAGKTTLVNAIAGTVPSVRGEITLGGTPISGMKPYQRVERGLGIVPEGRRLFPGLTVKENLRVGERAASRRASAYGMKDVLALFPILDERSNVLAGRLSGGEQQMLAIARTLIIGPSLLMLDEPSTGLAPRIFREVMNVIRTLVDDGVGVLIVEQNIPETRRIADYAYVLSNGKVHRHGPAVDILDRDELRHSYLG